MESGENTPNWPDGGGMGGGSLWGQGWGPSAQPSPDVCAPLPQAYLHSMNIIHRDLNSHNCLVREVSSLGLGGRGQQEPCPPQSASRPFLNRGVPG